MAEFIEKKRQVTDPVCGMELEPETAYSKVEYEGHTVYFCSQSCQEKFERDPEKYLSKIKNEPDDHKH